MRLREVSRAVSVAVDELVEAHLLRAVVENLPEPSGRRVQTRRHPGCLHSPPTSPTRPPPHERPDAPVPIVATLLIARYDSSATLALYVIAAGLLGALVIWSAPRAHAPVDPLPVERVPAADGARRAVQH